MKTEVCFKHETGDLEVSIVGENSAERAMIEALRHYKAKPVLCDEAESERLGWPVPWVRFSVNTRGKKAG
jgi:hypothetical protein